VLEGAQPAVVVGLVPQLGAGAVEGQDPQIVRVKGSERLGILWLSVMDGKGGFKDSSITDYRFLG
jgi:hypothetical protein